MAIMTDNRFVANEELTSTRRRCPHCTALSRLTHSILNTRYGNMLHVYQCVACGKRTWEDSPDRLERSL